MSGMRVVTAVRARPLSNTETSSGAVNILSYDTVSKGIGVTHPSAVGKGGSSAAPERVFNFDYNFWSVYKGDPYFSSQEDVFLQLGMPIIESCLRGMNCSLFAYGQTGSGKTYTMMGSSDSDENMGLIPRICRAILGQLTSKDLNIEGSIEKLLSAKVFVSFLEIYNEKIFDLLSTTSGVTSRVREHPQNGAYVENLTKVKADGYQDILQILNDGKRRRQVASTLMNSESSRSHAVFTIYVVQQICSTTEFERSSKVSLVDLAGSERVNNSGVTGDRLKEASNINKSLSTLGDVINALSEKGSGAENAFIPYRNSTLTWLLKDSLGGNSKTSMLATISPSDANYGESMSTLRYLERAKLIVNNVSINESHWENPQVAMLQKQLSELNAKYVALMKLHQSREVEYEATLSQIRLDLDNSSAAKVEELQRYVAHLENQLGLPQSHPIALELGNGAAAQADSDGAQIDAPADIESELNRSLPFSDHGELDPAELLNREELSAELEGAVSEMLSVVCGERVPVEDCGTAAAVFASVMDKHLEPMREKYGKLLERHKLLEKWYAQEREIVNAKNSQLEELTGEITSLRRNVFRSQSFAEEPSLLATIREGEDLLFEEDESEDPFDTSPVRGAPSAGKAATVMHKLGDELAEAMISLQHSKRIQEEQAEIHAIEMQALRDELKKAGDKLSAMRLERDSMASSVLEANNARAALESDVKTAQKEMRSLNAKFSDRLMAKDSEIALLTEQVLTLQSSVAETEGNYKKEIAILESHLKAQTKAVALLKAEKESVKRHLTRELDSTLLDTEASRAALREELEQARAELQSCAEELESLKEEREADAVGFLSELDMEELKLASAKKQWAAEEEKLRSEIGYWVTELENMREEAATGIDELRDALMSQSEVHKKYEAEKESEVALLKSWLEEAQAELEDIHKSKDRELAAVNETALRLKTDLESQVNEKSARIETMMENIDNLTRKCNKWDVAYDSLKKKYEDVLAKYSEQEQARQQDLELAREEFEKALGERDALLAAAEARHEEYVREAVAKQAKSDEALTQAQDELATQIVKYDMLELDEVTEVDALKTEIHDLEEKDKEKLKAVVADKLKVVHDMQSLSADYEAFRAERSSELQRKGAELEALQEENRLLQAKLDGSDERSAKLRSHQEERDRAHEAEVADLAAELEEMRRSASMAGEDLAVHRALLAEERAKLTAVYLSASAAMASTDPAVELIVEGVLPASEENRDVSSSPLEYDEDSGCEDRTPSRSVDSSSDKAQGCDVAEGGEYTVPKIRGISSATRSEAASLVGLRDVASLVLSFLNTAKDVPVDGDNVLQMAAGHSFDSLSLGSETIEGLAIAGGENGATVVDGGAEKRSQVEMELEESIHKLELDNREIIQSYESTISDIKEEYESKASALDIARTMQDDEINQLQEEISNLKAELERARSAIASAATPPAANSATDSSALSGQQSSLPAAASKPPPVKAKKKKSFWSCTAVDESEVVNPTAELPRR